MRPLAHRVCRVSDDDGDDGDDHDGDGGDGGTGDYQPRCRQLIISALSGRSRGSCWALPTGTSFLGAFMTPSDAEQQAPAFSKATV